LGSRKVLAKIDFPREKRHIILSLGRCQTGKKIKSIAFKNSARRKKLKNNDCMYRKTYFK
jgi:hypothetical protein